jgi:hypothetical protein
MVPAHVNKASTPPRVEAIQDSFFSSINFDDGENPWIPHGSNPAAKSHHTATTFHSFLITPYF